MRKEFRAAAIFGTAAILSVGGALTSQAAWEQEGNDWIYTDNSGNRMTNTWRQSGGYYFYLDSNGVMVTDQWIDDTYYVDANGVRVSNQWVNVSPGTNDAPNPDGGWFYLEASGQAAADGWTTINGQRYYFDSDGTMQYGWLQDEDNLYYLGDENDGAAKVGWQLLSYEEGSGQTDGEVADGVGDETWFYFQTNGRAVKASGENSYISRTINGERYYFDENGAMATGWAAVANQAAGDSTGISTLKYFGEDGVMTRGWRYLTESPEDDEDLNFSVGGTEWDYEGAWYYFDSSGVPEYFSSSANTLANATVRINGSRYFFDEYGRMRSGLIGFEQSDGTVISAYFGTDVSDGRMRTGRQTDVYEEDGERTTFYFSSQGVGQTGEQGGYLYYSGKLVRAEDGEDYQVFEVGGRLYLVNESGQVQDSNRMYRVSGEYRYEYNNGSIYYVGEDRERDGEVTEGEGRLPEIAFRASYTLGSR